MRWCNAGRSSAAMLASGALFVGLVGSTTPAAYAATVKEAKYGFSFSLPPKWLQVPLNRATVGKVLSAATKADPSLAEVLSTEVRQATKEHLEVLAIGPASGKFFPNLNISVERSPSALGGQALLTIMKAEVKLELAKLGVFRHLQVTTAKLPFGGAVQASYVLPLKAPVPQLAHGIQLYFVHGVRLYVVTFTATAEQQDTAVARVVEASWHWI